jgi:hypothetical protein
MVKRQLDNVGKGAAKEPNPQMTQMDADETGLNHHRRL